MPTTNEISGVGDAVRRIVATQAMAPLERVTPEATPDGLGLDSLALVEVIFAIEERFDIKVPFNANAVGANAVGATEFGATEFGTTEVGPGDFDISTVASIVASVQRLIRDKDR